MFRKSILTLLSDRKEYEALAFYKEKSTVSSEVRSELPKKPIICLKLSQAASDLGMGSLAKELADAYSKANSGRDVAAAGNAGDLDVQLQRTLRTHFSHAKALWVSSGVKEEHADPAPSRSGS